MWTVIEGNTLIVAACIPALGPLADLVLHSRAFGSSSSRSGGTRRKHYYLPNSHHYYHHHSGGGGGGGDGTTTDTGAQHSYATATAAVGGSTPLKDLLHNTNHHNNNNITNIITTNKGTTYPPPRFGKSGPNSGGRKRDGEGEGEGKEGCTGASSLAGSEDSILGPDDKPQQQDSRSGSTGNIIRGSTGILCSRSVSVSYAAARHAV